METSNDTFQDVDGEEEKSTHSFDEILSVLHAEREVILTIPADQEQDLRNGLRIRKGKVNQLMRNKGVEPAKETLAFNTYPAKDSQGKEVDGIVCVHIMLKERASVQVLKMEIPSEKF